MTTHKFAEASDSDPAPRYAIYWAPRSGTLLAQLGNAWLGRDAERDLCAGDLPSRPSIPDFTPGQLDALTAEPRRYALHATLKAPFALASGCDVSTLCAELANFASRCESFVLPPLRLSPIGRRFLALMPSEPCSPLDRLAARCVTSFDHFRRPATAEELSRRRAAGLDAVEEANLRRWGYPYVLDRFRFHITLTGPLDAVSLAKLRRPLAALFAPAIAAPTPITDIALFREPAPGTSFTLAARFPLAKPFAIST
jgi:putative phosphonate metabolism protein